MATARETLDALLDTLSNEQVGIVLGFVEALHRGRVITSVCEVADSGGPGGQPPPPDFR